MYAVAEAKRNLSLSAQKKRLEKLLTNVEIQSHTYEKIELPESIFIKEKDKPILLAAILMKADYLITGDVRDFGKFYGEKIMEVTIMPPSEYLKKLIPLKN